MNDVEISFPAPDPIKHHQVIDKRIFDPVIAPERHLTTRLQGCSSARIAAGKQCHLVPLPDQLFGQVGDDTLATAIEPRRTTFVQRSDLRDSHGVLTCGVDGVEKGRQREPNAAFPFLRQQQTRPITRWARHRVLGHYAADDCDYEDHRSDQKQSTHDLLFKVPL